MSEAIKLRAAGPADIPAIAAIYRHHVLHGLASFEEVPPDEAEMARRQATILAAGYPYLAAEKAGVLIGYAYASAYRPRSAYRFTVEDSVYLDPAARGLGVGTLLLGRLIELCTQKGFRQMIAVIGDSANAPSIRLHEKLGFRHTGTFHSIGFKFGRWVDSVLMQRALGAGDATLPT